MSENVVYFKMKNESQLNKIQIQGVSIQIKDLRQKIKEWLSNIHQKQNKLGMAGNENVYNAEELQILGEQEEDGSEKALSLADKVRQKSTVVVVRQPAHVAHSLCRSCYSNRQQTSTPCCMQPICSQCEQQFIRVEKCFFNNNSQCPFRYHNYSQQPIVRNVSEIGNGELEQAIKNAVFYIVKSNNELNVNLAKKHNVWATTKRNFGTLQSEFNNRHKVILIYTANRVEKFLGCARMVNTLVMRDSKWSWHATTSIQLADNFQIEWLRKGMVDFSKMQDTINPKTGDLVIRSKDCQEVPADIGQRICLLFEQIKGDEEPEALPEAQLIQQKQEQDIVQDEWELDQICDQQVQEKSPSPIEQAQPQPPQQAIPQPSQNGNRMALLNQLYQPIAMQQHMEANWMNMNKGKIPGLTGKVQYPHPFIQKLAQRQNKAFENILSQMSQRQKQSSSSSSSRSVEKKKKKRSHSRKKDKKSKHKKRSRSRDHKKSKKHSH